jgi:hypothetical protein
LTLTQSLEVKEAYTRHLQEIAEEGKRTAQIIEQSLTDALMRGFESGKGFGKNLRDTLKNMFQTLVLRPIVQFAVQDGMNFVSALLGGSNGGNSILGSLFGKEGSTFLKGLTGLFGENGSLTSTLSMLGSKIFTLFGSGATVGAFPGTLAYANAVGSLGGDSMAAFIAANNSWQGVSVAAEGGAAAASGTTAASGISATQAWAAFAAAMMMINGNLYSKGWDAGGQKNDITRSTIGTPWGLATGGVMFNDSIMRSISNAIGLGKYAGAIASIFSGSALFTRAFGRKKPQAREGGVEGMLSLDGFEGRQFQDIEQKGGWFRSDRRWTEWSDIDPELQRALNQTIGKVPRKIEKLLNEFGRDFSDVFGDDWEQKFRVVLTTDGKYENMTEMWDKATTGVYRDMAITAVEAIREGWGEYVRELEKLEPDEFRTEMGKILGSLSILDNIRGIQERTFGTANLVVEDFEALAYEGEKIYDAITRIADAFTLTNQLSRITGIKFAGVGLEGYDNRQDLIDDAGGADALTALMSTYWDIFATEQEKFDVAAESLRNTFSSLGIAMPSSVQGIKDLIAAQDMSTVAGREMALQLMHLAPAFNAVIGAIEQMSKSMDNTINDLRRSVEFGGLDDQTKYNKLKAEADDAYAQFQEATDPAEIQKLFDRITSNMNETWNMLDDSQKNAQRAAYLAKLDELQASKDDRIGALIDQYTGVDVAQENIAEAGNKLAQAILDVAGQLGADITDVVLKPLPEAIENIMMTKPAIDPLDFRNKPYFEEQSMREIAGYLENAMATKPLLLENNDPSTAFVAAQQLLQEMQEQQSSSSADFNQQVGAAGEGLSKDVGKAGEALRVGVDSASTSLGKVAARLEMLVPQIPDRIINETRLITISGASELA